MPMILDEHGEWTWVPPSQVIAKVGLEAFLDGKYLKDGKVVKKKKEVIDVTTTPLPARKGFTFGADPEFFVFKDDRPVTAEGLIPGTKAEPYPVKGGAIQVDGMAAEFNINPSSTFKEFNANIESVMKALAAHLPPGHELRVVPSVVFSEEDFNAAPEKAKELGCSPDYNAWEGKVNPPPKSDSNPFLRTAAGHLHVGWTEDASIADAQHVMNCCDLVKQFDWFLGAWSVKIDTDATRRSLYGRAGACRFKPYGVEYRVLSNFWITSRERRLAVWNRMQTAIDSMARGFLPDKACQMNSLLQESINSSKIDRQLSTYYPVPILSLEKAA